MLGVGGGGAGARESGDFGASGRLDSGALNNAAALGACGADDGGGTEEEGDVGGIGVRDAGAPAAGVGPLSIERRASSPALS
jgi:hypothetical protein